MKIIKMMSVLLLLISCSVAPDQEKFLKSLMGSYAITQAGKEFIRIRMHDLITTPIQINTILSINKSGEMFLKITDKNSSSLALFVEMKDNENALYQLRANNHYIVVAKKDNLLIATTNTFLNKNQTKAELLIPIAVKI